MVERECFEFDSVGVYTAATISNISRGAGDNAHISPHVFIDRFHLILFFSLRVRRRVGER